MLSLVVTGRSISIHRLLQHSWEREVCWSGNICERLEISIWAKVCLRLLTWWNNQVLTGRLIKEKAEALIQMPNYGSSVLLANTVSGALVCDFSWPMQKPNKIQFQSGEHWVKSELIQSQFLHVEFQEVILHSGSQHQILLPLTSMGVLSLTSVAQDVPLKAEGHSFL